MLSNLALLTNRLGQRDRAAALFGEALTLARGTGDRWLLALLLQQRAEALFEAGDRDRSEESCQESLRLGLEVGHKIILCGCLTLLAEIARVRGQTERDAFLLGATERLAESVGMDRPAARFDWQTLKALPGYQSAWARGKELTLEQAVAYALERPAK